MAIKTRSLLDVQCDLCQSSQTIESDHANGVLNGLGYRRIRLAIEPLDKDMVREFSQSKELVVCKECVKKVRGSLRMSSPEDDAETELELMKQNVRGTQR